MGLYKQGTVWYYELYVDGRRIRKSTGVTNRRVAEDIYAKKKLEIREGRFFLQDQGTKRMFKEMTDKYMAEYAVKKPHDSKQRDITSLNHLLPVFGSMYLSRISPNQISKYKTQREGEGASASSINKELAFAKHAFNLAIKEWEWVRDNPFTKIPMEKLNNARIRYLTAEEYQALLNACDDWLRPIVITAVNTGMRRGNIMSLTWKQVDLAKGLIVLDHTKNGSPLGLPMNDAVKSLFMELNRVRHIKSPYVFTNADGSMIKGTKLQDRFRQACKKAGLTGVVIHTLRHTCASWLVQNGVPLNVVQQLLGHKTIAMTMRYAHLSGENLRMAINSLNNTGTAIKTAIPVVD